MATDRPWISLPFMDAQRDTPDFAASRGEDVRIFGDLRKRNERRASVARKLEDHRKRRVEQALRAARQRRFSKGR